MPTIAASISAPPTAPWIAMQGAEFGERTLHAHEPLFHEGDASDYLFEVLDGVLVSYKIFADGRRQVMSFAYPGDLIGFGESDLFRFDCDAVSQARVRAVPRNSLLRAARERPELGEKLLVLAAGQLASLQDHSVLLGRKSAIEKLASFLVGLADRSNEDEDGRVRLALPMTRADIADFLGLTVETVSRNVTKLRMMKVIDLPRPAVLEIIDVDRLRDLAEWEESIH